VAEPLEQSIFNGHPVFRRNCCVHLFVSVVRLHALGKQLGIGFTTIVDKKTIRKRLFHEDGYPSPIKCSDRKRENAAIPKNGYLELIFQIFR
jgi:hypothetical protein